MKYPYIGKCNETVTMFFSKDTGECLLAGNKHNYIGQQQNEWLECNFKNITAEYLANTYGEVKSKEHAEFIVELAEVNGFRLYNPKKTDKKWFSFDDNELYFFDDAKDASDFDEKLITIPLPPESNANTPEEDFEMQQIAKNNGDNLLFAGDSQSNLEEMVYNANKKNAAIKTLENLGYTYHGAELWKPPVGKVKECKQVPHPLNNFNLRRKAEKSKEWPAVGDDVLYDGISERLKEIKGEIVKIIGRYSFGNEDYITVSHLNHGIFAMRIGSWIKKPKTPEEELLRDLRAHFESYTFEDQAITELPLKFNITKKPQ